MPDYTEAGMVDNDDDLKDNGKGGGKAMTAVIAAFIVVIWIAIFILLIKLDVGGFGSTVLYPVLKDVPIINNILPNTEEGSSLSSNSGETYQTLQQAIDRINALESELALYRTNSDTNREEISALTAEVERLRTYEDNQIRYDKAKKLFDEEIVYTTNAPSIYEYKKWYEEIDPDNAAEIYKQVLEEVEMEAELADLSKQYAAMKPGAAAAIFEEMTGDLEKVARILDGMSPANSAAILAAMDSTLAAKVTLLMYPTNEYRHEHGADSIH